MCSKYVFSGAKAHIIQKQKSQYGELRPLQYFTNGTSFVVESAVMEFPPHGPHIRHKTVSLGLRGISGSSGTWFSSRVFRRI